jgi:mRNA interferase MazF
MSDDLVFRRGDVLLVPFPFITDFTQSKLRPVLVLQNDVGNRVSSNLIVAAISSQIPNKRYPTSYVIRADTPDAHSAGLDYDSVVLTSVILTIPKASVVRRLGRLTPAAMQAVDECLRISLSL